MAATSSSASPANAVQVNSAIRQAVLSNGVARLQQIYASNVNPATNAGSPITINPQNVGLIRGFLVRIVGKFNNTGGDLATQTPLGLANLLSSIAFQDFSNVTRVNTTGWHLNMLNSAKNNQVFGGAYAPNVSVGYGNNWGLQTGPATIATGTQGAFTFFYYVPLAYTKSDLRGSVFAGLVGATAQLQLTLNPSPMVAAGSDPTLACYVGSAGAFYENVTVTVYQDYIDQIPSYGQLGIAPPQGVSAASPALPPVDMSTIYELLNTSQSAIVAGQDFGIAYTNLRTFLSTSVIFDNGGTLNVGSDINYWALTLANSANVWKYTPDVAALLARGQFLADPPAGCYYFDHRSSPINTQLFGNANLVVNANTVNAGAALLIGYEAFAMTNTIVGAPSIPS